MLKFSFLPREEKFFKLFEESAKNAVAAAGLLKELVHDWDNVPARVQKITELEHEGDTITHQIIEQLHRTFVTPLDREDIALMAHSIDDITDFIQAAADTMLLYKVNRPPQTAQDLCDIIVQSTNEVEKAVSLIRHSSKLKQLLASCVEINRLENVADGIYRIALGNLFDNTSDIAGIIKWREIYEQLESATDRCEDVANVLEGIAIKHG